MKALLPLLLALSLLLVTACDSNAGKGDRAWAASKKATGHEQLMKQKEAYFWYKKSVDKSLEKGKTIKPSTLNKYLETLITRIEYFYEAQGVAADSTTDATPILRQDANKLIVDENVRADLKDRYAELVAEIGVAYKNELNDLTSCMKELNFAVEIASTNKASIEKLRSETLGSFATEQLMTAQEFFKSSDPKDLIRAEFYTKVALEYDANNKEAQALLSKTRTALIKSYNAYISAIADYPDKVLFKKINSDKLFLAVPMIQESGSNYVLSTTMYNDAPNAVKLKPEFFTLTFDNGKTTTATSLKSVKPIVDQGYEGEITLTIPKGGSKIHTLTFKQGDYSTTKYFY